VLNVLVSVGFRNKTKRRKKPEKLNPDQQEKLFEINRQSQEKWKKSNEK
jgi:hypothetical protein